MKVPDNWNHFSPFVPMNDSLDSGIKYLTGHRPLYTTSTYQVVNLVAEEAYYPWPVSQNPPSGSEMIYDQLHFAINIIIV